jgi:hypothetical protein
MGISEPGDAGAARGHGVEETGATDATVDALLASGPMVSAPAPASMTLPTKSLYGMLHKVCRSSISSSPCLLMILGCQIFVNLYGAESPF